MKFILPLVDAIGIVDGLKSVLALCKLAFIKLYRLLSLILRAAPILLFFAIAQHGNASPPIPLWTPDWVKYYPSPMATCEAFYNPGFCIYNPPDGRDNGVKKYMWLVGVQLLSIEPSGDTVYNCLIEYDSTCNTWGSNSGAPSLQPASNPFPQYDIPSRLFCPPGEPQVGNQCGFDIGPNKGCVECAIKNGMSYTPFIQALDGRNGNPINALIGNKVEVQRDYTSEGVFPIIFERVYNSFGAGPGSVMPTTFGSCTGSSCTTYTLFSPPPNSGGAGVTPTSIGTYTNSPIDTGWRHNYDRALIASSMGGTFTATLYRPDSKTRTFTQANGVWSAGAGQLDTVLTQQVDTNGNTISWTYVSEDDETEMYDQNGKLLSITNRAGLTQTMQYSTGFLTSVTDAFGHQLKLAYYPGYNAGGIAGAGMLSSITAPDGGVYTYTYTNDGNNNLSTVTYPDGHVRQYVYENTQYPTALTGIIDENLNRFATWSYDGQGNAVLSEHAGGVEAVTVSYPSATSSIATDASGATRTYTTQAINGIAKASSVVETCGTNCTRTTSATYDNDGNITSSTDFNHNVTTYSYDLTRDLEISRTEASGTPQARTINTQWHPTYRLPVMISEPGRTTTYTYDANGNQLTKTIAAAGSSRTWAYTYNTNSQILTVTGPRTDVVDVTSYNYDASANLVSITNALGQVTALGNYDLNGRVGIITDPNGAVTTFTYNSHGWLTNKVVTAGSVIQSTTYNYDNVGQLTQVSLPDGSAISYTYDNAHRLTNIVDNLGDSINYTLDLMGNRTAETVTDPNGVLTSQITRIYDSVNRLQQLSMSTQAGQQVLQPAVNNTPLNAASSGVSNALGSVLVTLGSTGSSIPTSQNLTLTAAVSGSNGNVTGTIEFMDGANLLGTATIVNGNAVLTFAAPLTLAIGSHTFTAKYNGNAYYAVQTSAPVVVTVVDSRNVSSIAFIYPFVPSSISAGAPIAFQVQVSSAPPLVQNQQGQELEGISFSPFIALDPTEQAISPFLGAYSPQLVDATNDQSFGTVTFMDGNNLIGTTPVYCNSWLGYPISGAWYPQTPVSLSYKGCFAAYSQYPDSSALAETIGTHTITATYSGDSNYQSSTTSAQVNVTPKVATSVQMTCAIASDNILLACNITAALPPYEFQIGNSWYGITGNGATVEVVSGTTVLGSAQLINGTAIVNLFGPPLTTYLEPGIVTLPTGLNNLQAYFPGTQQYQSSYSAVQPVTVTAQQTSTLSMFCPSTTTAGTSQSTDLCNITLSTTNNTSQSAQTVQLMDGGQVIATGTISPAISSGTAIQIPALGAGVHTLQATSQVNGFTQTIQSNIAQVTAQ